MDKFRRFAVCFYRRYICLNGDRDFALFFSSRLAMKISKILVLV